MKHDPNKHHRRSIRLKGYDYSKAGMYFVTLVCRQRACLFGEVIDGKMRLSAAGQIVQQEWRRLGQQFPDARIDVFVVMPNHVHGIIVIHPDVVGATQPSQKETISGENRTLEEIRIGNGGSPLRGEVGGGARPANGPAPGSLGAMIGQFKSRCTKRLWASKGLSGTPIWQRNYYEHIIRNDDDYKRVYLYIESNPVNWNADEENPLNLR